MKKEEEIPENSVSGGLPEVLAPAHASMILNWAGTAIYVDPVGSEKSGVARADSVALPSADLILVTDIHPDHFDADRLSDITTVSNNVKGQENTVVIMPQAVMDQMPSGLAAKVTVMNNGDKNEIQGFMIEAIPMYNLPDAENASRHTKGRGNGYVIEKDGTRIYIAGDTAGIPEMRALKDIDMAFVPMNLPYTMGVEEAADAVLEFKPKKVYPYHYRTPEGYSDVAKFKQLVEQGSPDIEVVQLDWYGEPEFK